MAQLASVSSEEELEQIWASISPSQNKAQSSTQAQDEDIGSETHSADPTPEDDKNYFAIFYEQNAPSTESPLFGHDSAK